VDESFATRYVNDGFSGGEKKRLEMLQMAVLKPEMAILDETDSGLEHRRAADRRRGRQRHAEPEMGVLLITHYQRLLNYIHARLRPCPGGSRIVKSGGKDSRAPAGGGGLRPDPPRGRPGDERLR